MAAEGLGIAPAPQEESWAHFAVLIRADLPGRGLPAQTGSDVLLAWQAAYTCLSARVEHLSSTRALLDLGTCTDAEALGAVQGLRAYLAARDIPARAGIAPSGCLAELALLRTPAHVAVRLIGRDEAAELLYRTPVDLLPQLRVAGIATALSSEVVERLHRYGLRTLGQVGRLGELALRRQFGAQIGSLLAAIAIGRDPRPLVPTPPPASLRVRLRVPGDAIAPEQVPAVLAHFAEQVAAHLRALGRHARTLQVTILWETGAQQQVAHTLRHPTHEPALLLDALQRLLLPLLAPGLSLTDLHLVLLDFAPITPEQATFWRTQAQRQAALDELADTLTCRHGKPLLLTPQLVAPDAVFSEERHALFDFTASSTETTVSRADTQRPLSSPDMSRTAQDAWQDVPLHLHWW